MEYGQSEKCNCAINIISVLGFSMLFDTSNIIDNTDNYDLIIIIFHVEKN